MGSRAGEDRLVVRSRFSGQARCLLLFSCLSFLIRQAQCCPAACICDTNNNVNCDGKGLTSLPPDLPAGMTSLSFADNRLTSLGALAFLNFSGSLEQLNLSNNQIETVALDAFDSLTKLQKLYLQGNRISSLKANCFKDLIKVTEIDMSGNPLVTFPRSVFESCVWLSILKLRETGLTVEAFGGMSKLRPTHLDISGNNFSHLPYLMLSTNDKLGHLEINGAGVRSVDPNAFVGLLSLRYLKLAGNGLTRINRQTFQPLELAHLDLTNNALVCDCGTKQFQDWKESKGVVLLGGASCTSPDMREYDINNEDLSEFCTTSSAPPVTPTDPCGGSAKLRLTLAEVSRDQAVVTWTVRSLPGDLFLTSQLRVYGGGPEGVREGSLMVSAASHTFSGLTPDSQYVLCLLQASCSVYACLDFSTGDDDPGTGAVQGEVCVTPELTAGLAVAAAFLTLTAGMTVIYLVLRGVCCCPGRAATTTDSPPPSPDPGPVKRTQHVSPMQKSHGYVPGSPPHRLQSFSDTYDAIRLEPVDTDHSGKVFYNPSYRKKERPRNVNDPLPIPGGNVGRSENSRKGVEVIQGISSTYLHPRVDEGHVTSGTGSTPETYLEPMGTLTRRPSSRRDADRKRHTMNDILSASEPYHVYQEAMDDVITDLRSPRPMTSAESPETLKKQFASNKLPSLEDIKHHMETGTGRIKKFRRPAMQGDSRSVSTPDILAGDAQGSVFTSTA